MQGGKYPYIVPVSFGLEIVDGTAVIYFHSAQQGLKIDLYLSVMKRDCFTYLSNAIMNCPRFLVHVVCPVEELERRERERGDRNIGQAVWQLSRLIPEAGYDLTIDTFKYTVQENAETIIKALEKAGVYKKEAY